MLAATEHHPYAEVGARLVERGYAAIPIMPGTKRPGHRRGGEWIGLTNWREEYTRRPPTHFEIDHWSRSDAGVCVVTGPASKHLVAVDIDTDDPTIVEAILRAVPTTTVRKRGAKGETLFFRAPGLDASRSYNIAGRRVCDLIGPGRQTVLPPSIHPDTGHPYQWTGVDTLEDTSPEDLPGAPDDLADRIAEALRPHGYEPEPERNIERDPGEADKPHRMLNEMALANLDAWVQSLQLYRCRKTRNGFEAVATWRGSSSGRPDNKRALNLKITPDGIRDFGADRGYTPIDLVMAGAACDLDTAFNYLATRLGFGEQVFFDQEPASPLQPAEPIIEVPTKPTGEALSALTRVPGAVGDIIDWITATSRRPNRVLALGAAVGIVGTLIGRRVAGPTRTATHLYLLTIAPTGAGKQHPIDATNRLMIAAGARAHLGPSEFMSQSAVINHIQDCPLSLCTQDEFGAFLDRIGSKKASGHESGVSKILRSAWGSSFSLFVSPAWAGRKMETVSAPAMTIHGLSTPGEFYAALQTAQLANGFLNRFLLLSTNLRVPEQTPLLPVEKVPASLTEALQALYNWDGTQLGTARLNDPGLDPTPDILPWASNAAHGVYRDMVAALEQRTDKAPGIEHFMGRTAEIGLRLATILAAGRLGRGAAVDVADMEWGRDVALLCGESLAAEAQRFMAENERQGWANKIIEIVRKKGVASPRDIAQHIRGAIKTAEIKDILAGLCEGGIVDPVFSPTSKGPIPKVVGYRAGEN